MSRPPNPAHTFTSHTLALHVPAHASPSIVVTTDSAPLSGQPSRQDSCLQLLLPILLVPVLAQCSCSY